MTNLVQNLEHCWYIFPPQKPYPQDGYRAPDRNGFLLKKWLLNIL
jgi:hypothetical protein